MTAEAILFGIFIVLLLIIGEHFSQFVCVIFYKLGAVGREVYDCIAEEIKELFVYAVRKDRDHLSAAFCRCIGISAVQKRLYEQLFVTVKRTFIIYLGDSLRNYRLRGSCNYLRLLIIDQKLLTSAVGSLSYPGKLRQVYLYFSCLSAALLLIQSVYLCLYELYRSF